MIARDKECLKLIDLELIRAAKGPLTEDNETFISEHLAICPQCMAERLVLDEVANDNVPSSFSFDDLSKKRFISNIINEADKPAYDETIPQKKKRYASIIVATAAAAVVLVLTLAGLGIFRFETSSGVVEEDNELSVSVNKDAQTKISILLTSEQHQSIVAAGTQVKPGQKLASQTGSLAFEITGGISAIIEEDAIAFVSMAQGKGIEIRLVQGTLLVSVQPGREGPPFSVLTDRAEMRVTGTVFAVSAKPDKHRLQVLRGKVEVRGDNGLRTKVSANQVSTSPNWKIEPTVDADKEKMWQKLATLNHLTSQNSMTTDIQSIPFGAKVYIDETYIGKTPLTAQVGVGHHRLALGLDGYQAVKEQFDAAKDTKLTRMFELIRNDSTMDQKTAKSDGREQAAISSFAKSSDGSSQLLSMALKQRMEGKWKKAAKTYEELIRTYPASGEAKSALISLGKLQLDKLNQPRAALRRFDQYLSLHGGPLSREALFGKASAFRAIGFTDKEKETLQLFLKQYPEALEAPSAKKRLKKIEEEGAQ